MSVEHIEILVEEPSMEAALMVSLPRIIGARTFKIHAFQCKNEMLKKLPSRLQGYEKWLPKNWRIVVLLDRDDDDCHELKNRLERMANDAKLTTHSKANGKHFSVFNRLAIEELEAWYFGDWAAVKAAYPRVPTDIPKKAAYRDPDAIKGGTWESFERALQKAGYFKSGLRKIEAARAVATHWDANRNISVSFRAFRDALR